MMTNDSEPIVGTSPLFLEALGRARKVAKCSANIMLVGETGTGKEVFARHIHSESLNKEGPFVAINCSAIPEGLLESELFGHTKGAFTGAHVTKVGLFEEARRGTLFLDEIGDLSSCLQAKLLRVLQEGRVRRVGENLDRPFNCRIISATHRDLTKEIALHRFREDLFFRLNVIPINLPPLRERPGDLIPLAELFLGRFAKANNSVARVFSNCAIESILRNPWRGNVRELANTIERSVVLSTGPEVFLDESPTRPENESEEPNFADGGPVGLTMKVDAESTFVVRHTNRLPSLHEVSDRYIEYALSLNLGARDKTAREIGIDRKTLSRRLQSHNKEPNPAQHQFDLR